MIFRLILSLLLLLSTLSSSDENRTAPDEEGYIDKTHRDISNQVKKWSTYIDKTLDERINRYTDKNSTEASHEDDNATRVISENIETEEEVPSEAVDTFFQNEKFMDETEKSFVRVRTEAKINSLDNSKFNLKLRASLALSRSKKNVKLFISADQDNAKDFLVEDPDTDDKPELGVSFFTSLTKKIDSKYSVGIRGIYPFVRARYSMVKDTDLWKIEPVQTFQYSVKDDFKEYTRIYFDTRLAEMTLFRLELGRGTKSRQDGMDYDAALHLFWTPKPKTGLQFTQGFYGNTKYEYVSDDSVEPEEKDTYGGIHNYLTSIT